MSPVITKGTLCLRQHQFRAAWHRLSPNARICKPRRWIETVIGQMQQWSREAIWDPKNCSPPSLVQTLSSHSSEVLTPGASSCAAWLVARNPSLPSAPRGGRQAKQGAGKCTPHFLLWERRNPSKQHPLKCTHNIMRKMSPNLRCTD